MRELPSENEIKSATVRQAPLLDYLRVEVFDDAQKHRPNELEARGLLKRMDGAAAIITQATRDDSTPVREGTNVEKKARIAAELVIDGAAVMIDSDTTTLQAARHLAASPSASPVIS